jgi:hypothetical protein
MLLIRFFEDITAIPPREFALASGSPARDFAA